MTACFVQIPKLIVQAEGGTISGGAVRHRIGGVRNRAG
jgi:hypothetical protein